MSGPHRPLIVAHRGASAAAPENTLAAFEQAIALGADGFELDCTLTRDNEVVVIHDDTLDRTTNGRGNVADHTLDELKRLDVGVWFDPDYAGERIPTLREALDCARGRARVYIEIKDGDKNSPLPRVLAAMPAPGEALLPTHRSAVMEAIEQSDSFNIRLARAVIDVVRHANMEQEVVVMSFAPVVVLLTLLEAPSIRGQFLGASLPDNPQQWERVLRWRTRLNPAGFNPRLEDVSEGLVKQVHSDDQSIAVWTVNEANDMQRLIQWGVDAIITNHPDVAVGVLKNEETR